MGLNKPSHFLFRQVTVLFACLCLMQSALAQDRAAGRVQLEYVDQSGREQSTQLYGESHALIIGVSDYTNGWPDLPGVVKDVNQVRFALERQGFDVHVVMNPTSKEMKEACDDFIADYGWKTDSRLMFYYAGHGHTRKRTGMRDMGYIVPADAPNPNVDERGFYRKAMDMRQVEGFARRIESIHAMFLFDSCFSGSLFALSREVPPAISDKTSKPVRQFITAGNAEQTVPDDSIFRHQFVEALNGEADRNRDGYITGSELGDFLHEKVTNYTYSAQTPQYGKIRDPYLDKGDFVFALGPTPTPTVTPRPTTSTHSSTSSTGSTKPPQKPSDPFRAKHDAAYNEAKGADDSGYTTVQQKIDAWQKFLSDWPVSPEKGKVNARIKELKMESAYEQAVASESVSEMQQFITQYPDSPRIFEAQGKLQEFKSRGPSPGDIKTLNLGGGVSMDLVYIKPGTFTMGSSSSEIDRVVREYGTKREYIEDEAPQTTVTLTKGFWMGKTEVTQAQWRAVMGSTPSKSKGDNNPVEQVSWDDCMDFCKKLSSKAGVEVTLPTEAQWEYACRAGTTTRFSFGDSDSQLGDYAWYKDNSGKTTHPVATKKPNAFGLYDMHGNVWEWCLDWFGDYPGGNVSDYKGASSGSHRVYRGGSWFITPRDCRSASRGRFSPGYRGSDLGFRVVSPSVRR